MCCGYPGIDWYKGKKRLALTAVQHGMGIRWKKFGTSYVGPIRFYGDVPLTTDSALWLIDWLRGHGVTNRVEFTDEYREKMKRIANKAFQVIGDPESPQPER